MILIHILCLQVTFENIGKLFVSFEPGPLLDTMDKLFNGLVQGIRAQPSNFPGTAFRRAIQVRLLAFSVYKPFKHIAWKQS